MTRTAGCSLPWAHGINDVDTATLMPMESGSIMYASVTDVKKGESGAPGELHGSFDVNRDLGDLYANTNLGIYGVLAGRERSPLAGRLWRWPPGKRCM